MKLLQTKNAETARIQSWLDIKENEVTHIRSRAIMLETCGCPVENPECRFLQDAVEAKKKLPAAETELETYAEAVAALTVDNTRIEELDQQAGHGRRQMEEIETAEAKLEVLRRQATEQGQLAAGYEELKRAFSQDGIPHMPP